MSSKAPLILLALILGLGGIISYNQINKEAITDTIVVADPPPASSKAYMTQGPENTVVDVYYYAIETSDEVLVPLIFASEVLTSKDKDMLAGTADAYLAHYALADIDDGVDHLMTEINTKRKFPVYIEVIRITE